MQALLPPGWRRPKGFSHGIKVRGTTVFVAGQVGWDENEVFQSEDLTAQTRQALKNVVAVLAEAGAKPEHIVRMNWFLANSAEYNASLAGIGQAYREIIGKHFPTMTALEISNFVEKGAKVEIEVTAVIPD